MKRRSVLSIGSLILLAAAPLLMAQAPDLKHMYVHAPVRISDMPQNPSSPSGIFPAQVRAAYGFNRIPNQGAGQTIAVIDAFDNPNVESDLAVYESAFHIAPCNFQKVKIGNPLANEGWALESSLDVEQACAFAPQANIILVEATTQSLADLFTAVQVAASSPNNATVISMSWGYGEFSGETDYDSEFCNTVDGNGQPVTLLAASGDRAHTQNIYPAASPCVVSVGGTDLISPTPLPPPNPTQVQYGVETAWDESTGGVSLYETQPSYQTQACAQWSTTSRCVPDIASVAHDIPVYVTYGYAGWETVDGTSVASPDWAGFFTVVNSMRAAQGKGTLSQAAQDLYAIYYSPNYSANFHDITTGNNGNCGSQCDAGPGYDLVTGIGTYQANILATALVADPN